MKKASVILLQAVCMLLSLTGVSQVKGPHEPGGLFKVCDRFGKEYSWQELVVGAENATGATNAKTSSVPSYTCSAGYFNLYFATGSCFDGSSSAAASKRTVLCQLLTDISNFINSPLSVSGNTVRVNMYCGDTPANAPLTLGTAGAYYVFPNTPSNPYPGIIDNQIQKAIVSGKDPYADLSVPVFSGALNFYHGVINANANPSGGSWNYNLNTLTIGASEFDFYTIMLHELTHALGFGSLIDATGSSKFGLTNNYYARYDLFLKTQAGTALLAPSSPACSASNLSFQGAASILAPGTCNPANPGVPNCASAIKYMSPNVNVSVCTPACWAGGTSLSHFEDYCSTPSGYSNACSASANPPSSFNDLYYVMSDAAGYGSCYVKRYLKEEERKVLCDLGYSVKSTYQSSTTAPAVIIEGSSSSHAYSGSQCPGTDVWGINDGLVNGVYTFTVLSSAASTTTIPISTIIFNDASTTTGISCVESVYSNATAVVSGANLVVNTSTGFNGLVLVKYLPKNASGTFGNATYVYVYFLPGTCNPPNACNLIQNGGFESTNVYGQPCGQGIGTASYDAAVSCWDGTGGSPDMFRRGCLATGVQNLGTNTWNTSPPVDSYSGAPNNAVVGLGGGFGSNSESVTNNLSSPLMAGQTYQVSLWALNCTDPHVANTITPIVLTVASVPNFPSPSAPATVLAEFTVSPSATLWSQFTGTFVYSPSVSHSAVRVYVDGVKTAALGYGNVNSNFYCFIDDISIIALPTPTFVIPNASGCGNVTFLNLGQYASPVPGVFAGTGVTSVVSGGTTTYHFNAAGSLPQGTYPVSFTFTTGSGCTSVLYQNIVIAPVPNITATSSNFICSNTSPVSSNLAASCTSCPGVAGFIWLPGGGAGASQIVSPSSTTIYTATSYGGLCSSSQTVQVTVQNACCTQQGVTAYSQQTISGTAVVMTSPTAFNADLTISGGAIVALQGSEYMFAPNVKIIVDGSVLRINSSHLYACNATMWQGIVVKNGGQVYFQYPSGDNLIEDAVTAVDFSGPAPLSSYGNFLKAQHTTFNKNYTDINIDDYQYNDADYHFQIDNCVFTCRNLPFSSTAWPQTGASSAVNTTAAQLRTAITPTTGLASPYLAQSGFALTNLKAPYNSVQSNIAIKLHNVGLNTSSALYSINVGTNVAASDFNLFDGHTIGIFAVNSNVRSVNNVFQNTYGYATGSPYIGNGMAKLPAAAIISYITGLGNNSLNISATNVSLGNRFWNCQRGVYGNNLFYFDAQNVLFRSTQTTANAGAMAQGNTGIYLSSNRFGDYYVLNNEYTNISNGINLAIVPGTYFVPSASPFPQSGVYANRMRFLYSNFSNGGNPINYMSNAIVVNGSNNTPYFVPTATVSPFVNALVIQGNTISNAYRGISVNGIVGFQTQIEDNSVTLNNDIVFNAQQHAIRMDNCNPASAASLGKNILANNVLSFAAASSTTNINGSLVFCGNNGYGLSSPSVTCNRLSKSHKGFVFDGPNSGALWAGNSMSLPMARGFMLDNAGFINVQGGLNTANANVWIGGTWNPANGFYGTYVGANSQAVQSPLWVKPPVTTYPPTPNGDPLNPQNWYGAQPNTINIANGGDYNCEGIPNYRTISLPQAGDYYSEDQYYMAKTALYRFLRRNDSIISNDPDFAGFFASQAGSTIDMFVQMEDALYKGDMATVTALNNDISASNTIETNYKTYYQLYTHALYTNYSFTAADSNALADLCKLCPGTGGACIYQARALYNAIYNQPFLYNGCTDDFTDAKTASQAKSSATWDVDLFPNPASGEVSIVGKDESADLNISVKDLRGRVLVEQNLKCSNFKTKLELNLVNGAYLITITNADHETVTKKLLISK